MPIPPQINKDFENSVNCLHDLMNFKALLDTHSLDIELKTTFRNFGIFFTRHYLCCQSRFREGFCVTFILTRRHEPNVVSQFLEMWTLRPRGSKSNYFMAKYVGMNYFSS